MNRRKANIRVKRRGRVNVRVRRRRGVSIKAQRKVKNKSLILFSIYSSIRGFITTLYYTKYIIKIQIQYNSNIYFYSEFNLLIDFNKNK